MIPKASSPYQRKSCSHVHQATRVSYSLGGISSETSASREKKRDSFHVHNVHQPFATSSLRRLASRTSRLSLRLNHTGWLLLQISSLGRSIPSPTPTGGTRPSILSPPLPGPSSHGVILSTVIATATARVIVISPRNLLDKVLKVRPVRQDLSLAPSYRQERLCGATQSMPSVGRSWCSCRAAGLAVKGRLVTMDPLIRHFSTVPNTEPTGRNLQSCGYSGQRKLPYSNRFTAVARLAARYTDSPGAYFQHFSGSVEGAFFIRSL